MPRSRQVPVLLLLPILLMLPGCEATSNRNPGFRDVVLVGHPLCGKSDENPCQDIKTIRFEIFANSTEFSDSVAATQEYIEEMMPSKLGRIFEEDVTFSIVGIPYTGAASASNFRADGLVVRILFTKNPETLIPPMVSVLVSNETIVGIKQTICHEDVGAGNRCFEEIQELLKFYFTPDFHDIYGPIFGWTGTSPLFIGMAKPGSERSVSGSFKH